MICERGSAIQAAPSHSSLPGTPSGSLDFSGSMLRRASYTSSFENSRESRDSALFEGLKASHKASMLDDNSRVNSEVK